MLRILGLVLYISPAASSGRGAYFFVWWIIYFSSWSLSVAKIMAFEPPPNASKSFGSYFRRPNRFIKLMLNKYMGWSMSADSEKSGLDVNLSTTFDKSTDKLEATKSNEENEENEETEESSIV
jgi:hypothetical protein